MTVQKEYFNQNYDPRWCLIPYSDKDIAQWGCGPTAAAMAVDMLTGAQETQATMAAYANTIPDAVTSSGGTMNYILQEYDTNYRDTTADRLLQAEAVPLSSTRMVSMSYESGLHP